MSARTRTTVTRLAAAAVLAAGTVLAGIGGPAAAAAAYTCADPATGANRPATVVGSPGNDTIWVRSNDVVVALAGRDTIFTDNATGALICADEGDDYVGNSSPFGTTVGGFAVRGGDGRDQITGGTGADNLFGGPDDDVLDGRDGTDVVNGAAGSDQCRNAEFRQLCEF